MNIEQFIAAYIECALWSSNDESTPSGGYPLDDNYGPEDLDPETKRRMRADCIGFIGENEALLEGLDSGQAGHDFWLTRNGHGAGFWDRGLGELGDKLTKACKVYGDFNLIVQSDGTVGHL